MIKHTPGALRNRSNRYNYEKHSLNLFLSSNEKRKGGLDVIILAIMLVILGLMCWALCELISVLVGLIFVLAGMAFLVKMTKYILK